MHAFKIYYDIKTGLNNINAVNDSSVAAEAKVLFFPRNNIHGLTFALLIMSILLLC